MSGHCLYAGLVVEYRPNDGRYVIHYDDGDRETLDLATETVRWLHDEIVAQPASEVVARPDAHDDAEPLDFAYENGEMVVAGMQPAGAYSAPWGVLRSLNRKYPDEFLTEEALTIGRACGAQLRSSVDPAK